MPQGLQSPPSVTRSAALGLLEAQGSGRATPRGSSSWAAGTEATRTPLVGSLHGNVAGVAGLGCWWGYTCSACGPLRQCLTMSTDRDCFFGRWRGGTATLVAHCFINFPQAGVFYACVHISYLTHANDHAAAAISAGFSVRLFCFGGGGS